MTPTPDGGWSTCTCRRPGREESLAVREQQGDASRLLYVALTRAKHATAVWWSHEGNAKHSALTRLLFGRDPATGVIDPERYDVDEFPLLEPDEAIELRSGSRPVARR